MRQVRAIDIRLDDEQTVQLPHSSTILAAKMRGDTPALFYATPAGDAELVPVTVIMRHTEDREGLPEFDLCYLGTIQETPGQPWWHVFTQFSSQVYATGVLL
jgi:hypothetical protein